MFVYVDHNIQIFANISNAMLPQVLDVQKFIKMWSMQICEVYITTFWQWFVKAFSSLSNNIC